ncbi:MAG: DUF4410 domain-containing protein [Candidatus Acidiferrales bacterium]
MQIITAPIIRRMFSPPAWRSPAIRRRDSTPAPCPAHPVFIAILAGAAEAIAFVFSSFPQLSSARFAVCHGEVISWHSGNRSARMMVGMGSGRETVEIHYWLTDAAGKKVFEHTDTIRQAFWGNAYANSVGQLAQPFADKIAARLKERKVQ